MIKETKNAIMNKHNAVLENISLSETAESACGRRTAYTCNSSAAKLVSAKLPHTASYFFSCTATIELQQQQHATYDTHLKGGQSRTQ